MRLEPEVIRQRVKEWLDSGQDELPDELADALKYCDRFAVSQRSVLERYLAGTLDVRFDFLVKEVSGHRSHYRAVVNSVLERGDELPSVWMGEGKGHLNGESGQGERVMLVHVRQFGELVEGVNRGFVRVHSVRLERGHNLQRLHRDGVQLLKGDGLVQEVIFGQTDRELRLPGGSGAVTDSQFVSDVIERGPQIMNDVTDDDGEIQRWLFDEMVCESGFAVARIAMTAQMVRVRIHVSSSFVIESYEMFVGTPELRDNASERMRGGLVSHR